MERRALICVLMGVGAVAARADMRFDVDTFNASPEYSADHMNQALFNELNFVSGGGHQIDMGSDAHRGDLAGEGNVLGSYYNTWTNIYNGQATKDGAAAADMINSYVVKGFETAGGARPGWVVLNELSGSLWPNTGTSGTTYRQWVLDCVTKLHEVYGYNVIAYAPFANPAAHASDWQVLGQEAYIGIENYLSGQEMKDQGFSVAWAQGKYQSSMNSYVNLGVPASKLILGEEFAYTVAGTGYGRDGVSDADWEAAIRARSQAIYNVGFAGFIGYAWSKNGMQLSDAQMEYAEDVYRSTMVVQGEQPGWVSGGGGSWNVRNNWLAYDVVPNAAGAAANFGKAMTAASVVTLDGDKRVGVMTFNNAYGVTISAGTGGALTMDGGGGAQTIGVVLGAHVIGVPVDLGAGTDVSIGASSALKLSGKVTGVMKSLSIGTLGTLDLTNNSFAVGAATNVVRQWLFNGRNGGTWNGTGLVSSTAAGDGQRRTAIGYSTSGGTVGLKYTWYGDANLDGQVTEDDYALIDRGFAKHLLPGTAVWSDGDFDYSGSVTSADYALMDRGFALSNGGVLEAGLLAEREAEFGERYVEGLVGSVPEPGVGVLVFAWGLGRKRRR